MNEEKQAFIYLDKNILQYDYEDNIKLQNNENICYVYSDEHFSEINRLVDERIFEVLARIRARKINIKLDKKYNMLDEARLLDYEDPKALYESYLKTISGTEGYSNIFRNIQPFTMGNVEAIDPQYINENFVFQMKKLLSDMPLEKIPQNLTSDFEKAITVLGKNLEDALANAKDKIIPIDKMRKKITKEQLSELKNENGKIIDQIWNLVYEKFPGIEKDQLFGKKPLPYMKIIKMPIFLTVVQCHSALNMLGYFPDKGLTKTSKVFGINSDASHIAHSVFCSGIYSADDHLCKKAQAIYQYLGLEKYVIQLVL